MLHSIWSVHWITNALLIWIEFPFRGALLRWDFDLFKINSIASKSAFYRYTTALLLHEIMVFSSQLSHLNVMNTVCVDLFVIIFLFFFFEEKSLFWGSFNQYILLAIYIFFSFIWFIDVLQIDSNDRNNMAF